MGQDFYVPLYPFAGIFPNQPHHIIHLTVSVVGIKSVIIPLAVGEFDVDGWIAAADQFQVQDQPAGAAVAVNKGVDTLELQVKTGDALNGVHRFLRTSLSKSRSVSFGSIRQGCTDWVNAPAIVTGIRR